MPTAATKTAPKLPAAKTPPAKPQSLLIAPDENLLEDAETIRRTVSGLAAGEGCDDPAAYRAAAIRRGFTPILEAFAIEAARTFGNFSAWPGELQERLADVEADEVKWRKAEQEADLALTRARNRRRAAQLDRENLWAEDRQARYIQSVNPLLCGPIELAAQHVQTPALTSNEASQIIGSQYQNWAIDEARKLKLHYAQQDAKASK